MPCLIPHIVFIILIAAFFCFSSIVSWLVRKFCQARSSFPKAGPGRRQGVGWQGNSQKPVLGGFVSPARLFRN